eukprot:1213965-Prymnesium_polylepis.1
MINEFPEFEFPEYMLFRQPFKRAVHADKRAVHAGSQKLGRKVDKQGRSARSQDCKKAVSVPGRWAQRRAHGSTRAALRHS